MPRTVSPVLPKSSEASRLGCGAVGDVPGLDGVLDVCCPPQSPTYQPWRAKMPKKVPFLVTGVVDVGQLELIGQRAGRLEVGVQADGAGRIADVDDRDHRLLVAVVVAAAGAAAAL